MNILTLFLLTLTTLTSPIFLLPTLLPTVSAHGYLSTPRSRNYHASLNIKWWGATSSDPFPETSPNGLNLGGTCGTVDNRNYDSPKNALGGPLAPIVQECYNVGSVIELETVLTAHHGGHFEFKACPITVNSVTGEQSAPTQGCFDAHPLVFVSDELYDAPRDPLYSYRAYLPDVNRGFNFRHRYKLPDALSGEVVLIQWHYITGNTCTDKGYDTYDWPVNFASQNSAIECPSIPPTGGGAPEQFWNCAEVKISNDCNNPGYPDTTLTATTTARPYSQKWYMSTKLERCVQDCDPTSGAFECMGRPPNDAKTFPTVQECCVESQTWVRDAICVAEAMDAPVVGTCQWYPRWSDGQCVRDCQVNNGPGSEVCGGLAEASDTSHFLGTSKECCDKYYGWKGESCWREETVCSDGVSVAGTTTSTTSATTTTTTPATTTTTTTSTTTTPAATTTTTPAATTTDATTSTTGTTTTTTTPATTTTTTTSTTTTPAATTTTTAAATTTDATTTATTTTIKSPTASPTASPTKSPTSSPIKSPTVSPTKSPSTSPSRNPTTSPSKAPTKSPTKAPTASPSLSPTVSPTASPVKASTTTTIAATTTTTTTPATTTSTTTTTPTTTATSTTPAATTTTSATTAAASTTTGPYTNQWYVDDSTNRCVKDCDPSSGLYECKGTLQSSGKNSHDTPQECCSHDLSWKRDIFCVAEATNTEPVGSCNWYISYSKNKCVQDCKEGSGASCGGFAEKWQVGGFFASSKGCCDAKLSWVGSQCYTTGALPCTPLMVA